MKGQSQRSKSEFVRPRDRDLTGHGKSYIGIYEFITLLTPQSYEIAQHMIQQVQDLFRKREMRISTYDPAVITEDLNRIETNTPSLTFKQFRLWLDINPYVRTLFMEAVNPLMWMIDSKASHPKLIQNQGSQITIDWTSQKLVYE